jgi:hypothetical protein
MANFNKFNQFVEDLAEKVHNLGSDTLKILLTNVAPAVTNSVKGDLTEISAGFGYSAGGNQAVQTGSSQSSGLYTLSATHVTFLAAGGSIGPFRYAVLYNDTPSSPADPLIGFLDYGSSITLSDGQSFIVRFNSTTPGTVARLS